MRKLPISEIDTKNLTLLFQNVRYLFHKGYKLTINHFSMTKKVDIILIELVIIAGFILMIKSVYEIMDVYFIAGLLLFTLGCYWFGYNRGYGMGRVSMVEEIRKKKESD